MERFIAVLGITTACWLTPACAQRSAAACPKQLLGTWEYRQAAGDGFDAEGERLQISCERDSLRGLYFGLEREGEEGLFYTMVQVKDLRYSPAGEIAFTVPERELYAERPQSTEALKRKPLPSSGLTRDELHYRGRVESGTLILTCDSKSGTCPDKTLTFKRASP